MDDNDYIRAAVELADGFGLKDRQYFFCDLFSVTLLATLQSHPIQPFLDALAAQLRKQAQFDPHITFHISVNDSASYVEMLVWNPNGDEEAQPLQFVAQETDEAIAFIKVIVDSKVLK